MDRAASFVMILMLLSTLIFAYNDSNTTFIVLLIVLICILLWHVLQTMGSKTEADVSLSVAFQPTEDEVSYYLKCFQACDADGGGHMTSTELKNAFNWMDVNPFGDRTMRKADFLYVDELRKEVDAGKRLTLEFPQFVNLMKTEKIFFAHKLCKDADRSGTKQLHKQDLMDVLKTAGFVFNSSWIEVLEKFDHKKNNIVSYDQFLAAIKSK